MVAALLLQTRWLGVLRINLGADTAPSGRPLSVANGGCPYMRRCFAMNDRKGRPVARVIKLKRQSIPIPTARWRRFFTCLLASRVSTPISPCTFFQEYFV